MLRVLGTGGGASAARRVAAAAATRGARAAAAAVRGRAAYAAAASGEQLDVVVVGGGPGGYVAAIKAAQRGLKTACVESRGALGGTCLNVGCIPSKALLNSSHLLHEAQHDFEKNHGIVASDVRIDIGKMQKSKARTVKGLTGGIAGLFKKYGVQYVEGFGSFADPHTIAVAAEAGGAPATTLSTRHVIVASGSVATELPFMPFDEQRIVSSTGALEFDAAPERLIVVGGGVIGLELGSVWSRLGSDVTVVEFADQLAYPADKDVAKELQKLLKRQGLKFEMKRKVVAASTDDAHEVVLQTEAADGGSPLELRAEKVLVSVGRRPFTGGLNLDAAGLATNARGQIDINERHQTAVPHIYAIGDVVRGPMLAHKAEEEGIAAVEDIVRPGSGHVNLDAIPSVIYTEPEVAWVGKSEVDLKAAGVAYNIGKFPFLANSRARANHTTDGFVKLLADKETDRLLGAHIVGRSAGELIQELVLAIEYGASSEDVALTSHGHPNLCEAVKEAALACHDKPIHM